MKRLVILPGFRQDLAETRAWYLDQAPHLDQVLRSAVLRALEAVRSRPLSFAVRRSKMRRAPVPGFPLGVFFLVHSSTVVVVALLHTARRPGDQEPHR